MHFHVALLWGALSCFPIWLTPRKAWGLQGQAGRSVWQKRRQYPLLKYFPCISAVWIQLMKLYRNLRNFTVLAVTFFNLTTPYFKNPTPFLWVSRNLQWKWISVQGKCDGIWPCNFLPLEEKPIRCKSVGALKMETYACVNGAPQEEVRWEQKKCRPWWYPKLCLCKLFPLTTALTSICSSVSHSRI